MKNPFLILIFVLLTCSTIGQFNTKDLTFAIGTGFDQPVLSSCVLQNGKIIVGGSFSSFDGNPCNAIARLNADGSFDTTFDMGSGFNNTPIDLVEQNDGKVIVSGRFTMYNGEQCGNIIRLNTDGSRDQSFLVANSGFQNSMVEALKLQNDGKILVSGMLSSFNGTACPNLVRLNADGSLDPSLVVPYYNQYMIHDFVFLQDGSMIVGGGLPDFYGTGVPFLSKVNSDGSIDSTFSNNLPLKNAWIFGIHLTSDQKILLTGQMNFKDHLMYYGFVRLNLDGTLDPSYITYPGITAAFWSEMQADGKLLVSMLDPWLNEYHPAVNIFRFYPNGQIDTTFVTNCENVTIRYAKAQGLDKLIVIGSFAKGIFRIENCQSTFVEQEVSSCGSYTWIDGKTYQSDQNRYFSVPGNSSCDTVYHLNLDVALSNVVYEFADMLVSNEDDATYQWYNCVTGQEVPGAVEQLFTPVYFGNYRVKVTKNGCSVFSDCVKFKTLEVDDLLENALAISPNPTLDWVQITGLEGEGFFDLYGLDGRVLARYSVDKYLMELDFSFLQSGIYLLKFESGKQLRFSKI